MGDTIYINCVLSDAQGTLIKNMYGNLSFSILLFIPILIALWIAY